MKLKSYKNRDKCITALKAIAAEIRTHDTAVTMDNIKKKIDTLRNQFYKSQELEVRMCMSLNYDVSMS